jgi:acyl-coenzyme A thioesterase PaaI-like protein
MSRQPTSRSCFVCGRENPVGLKVKWDQDPEAGEIRGTVTIPGHFNGYPGVTHGGIVGAILDETAGRTILMDGGFEDLMVTAKLEVVYRRPTPTEAPLLVVGRLLKRSGARAEAEAELRLPDGTVTARATVLLESGSTGGWTSAEVTNRDAWAVSASRRVGSFASCDRRPCDRRSCDRRLCDRRPCDRTGAEMARPYALVPRQSGGAALGGRTGRCDRRWTHMASRPKSCSAR